MIKWLTKKLGTASYYDYEKLGSMMDVEVVDVREMVDREGNDPDFIMAKIKKAQRLLLKGRRVVVCCDKGISRSNSIALGILMASGVSYGDALNLLTDKIGILGINLGLLHDVRILFGAGQKQKRHQISNILVTGSTGFVGRTLVKDLSVDYKLFCPTKEELDLAHNLSLLDLYVNKNNINFIIHLAHPKLRNSVEAMAEGVAMMKNILEVCRLNRLGVLYLSGLVVFSGYTTNAILKANSSLPVWPKGTYGETKFLCEELIKTYRKTYGLEVIVLRPAALYGNGMDRDNFISKFFKYAIQNVTIRTHRYRNGLPLFDLLYVDDLVEAIKTSLKIRPNRILNIGTGKGTSTYELARKIVKLCNSSSKVETIDIHNNISKVIVDDKEANKVLGWKYKTNLSKGLKKLLYIEKSR